MRTRPSRGFTLIELLVTAAVSAIVVAAVYGAVSAQQRAYYDGNRQRASQTAARDALLALERIVSIAGYGMDAPLAIDLDRYAGNCPAQMGACTRDATDNADELVVLARDPNYWTPASLTGEPAGHAWRIPTPAQNGGAPVLTDSSVTVNARPGDRFAAGQILQAVCQAGGVFAYFTVASTTASVTSAGTLSIPLRTIGSTDYSDPFRQQNWATQTLYSAMNSCFNSGQARVFLVERYRFHVRPVPSPVTGAVAAAQYTPYLVLDPGKDANFDGNIDAGDETVLAEGIETFQVAYVMNNPALALRGLSPGTAITFVPAAVSAATQSASRITTLLFPGTADSQPPLGDTVYSASSFYPYSVGPPPDSQRNTDHQANVVAIRIGIVARSPDPEPAGAGGDPPQLLYNMNAQPTWIDPAVRFARTRVETTIPLRNAYVRGMNDF